MNPDNPLLTDWTTPFKIAPFDLIRPEHFKPAVEEAITVAKNEIEQIVANPGEPDFINTLEAIERAGMLLSRITPILYNRNSSDTSPELQEAAREVSPLLTNFANDITLNPELFRRVKSVYDRKEDLVTDKEQMILLDRRYRGFIR